MAAATDKLAGTVKWFDSTKGFGFITPHDGTPDVFVHQTSIYSDGFRSLAEGEEVEYRVIDENNRQKAVDVTGPDGAFVRGTPKPDNGGGSRNPRGGNSFGGGQKGQYSGGDRASYGGSASYGGANRGTYGSPDRGNYRSDRGSYASGDRGSYGGGNRANYGDRNGYSSERNYQGGRGRNEGYSAGYSADYAQGAYAGNYGSNGGYGGGYSQGQNGGDYNRFQ